MNKRPGNISFSKKAHYFIATSVLLGIYSAFFAVQLLYNFESRPFNDQSGLRKTDLFSRIAGQQQIHFHNSAQPSSKHILRLNKRFQPAAKLLLVRININTPVFYRSHRLSPYNKPWFLNEIYRSGPDLRGPPFVA